MPDSPDCPIEVDVLSVKDWLDRHDRCLLLDCRENDEYRLVHLSSARHIPMNEVPQRITELGANLQQPIVVYCHHGGRSMMVAQWLRGQGYERAQSMEGGIDAWSLKVDDTMVRY